MNINMGWKGWLICSILGLILIAQMMPKVPDSPKVRACFAAEGFVRNRLVSPSTASFTNCYDPAANVSATAFGFSIYGTVDSQNSFGAMIRSKYHVELNNDGEDYRLVSISID